MTLTKIDDRGLKTPIDLLDNEKIRFGTGNDFQIYHDGNNTVIDSNTGNLYLQSGSSFFLQGANNENVIKYNANGAVELYYDNSKKLETDTSGVTITGRLETTSNIKAKQDGIGFRSGASDDLQLYHDGSNSYLSNDTGYLFVQSDNISLAGKSAGENYLVANLNGSVQLYYDSAKKFETTADGVYTSGKIVVEQAGTGQTFLNFNADLGSNNDRELSILGPTTDSDSEPFRVMTNNALAFFTDGTESFRMLHNRNVGFGTTSPDERVHIGDDHKLRFKRANVNGDGSSMGDAAIRARILSSSAGAIHTMAGNNAQRTHFRFYNNNGNVGAIRTNNNNTSFNTSSDYRLKENAVRISDGITRLKTLKPYKFNFKNEPSLTVDGFFAHEATQIPGAVGGTKDEVVTQAMVNAGDYPESDLGNPIYQDIDHSKFVPLLTAALQDAVAKIETLETKVAALA